MTEPVSFPKIVEVAAAVLIRSSASGDEFLLAQRPADKIWAGHWEFPGGKVEPGETAHAALVRELHEELGIAVQRATPWLVRQFTYPHATVRLNFFRVTAWQGELHPHEGQQFAWQPLAAFSAEARVAPLLPANAPVLRALSLPALYAISNAGELGGDEFLRRLQRALAQGLRLLQLREKDMPPAELRALAIRTLDLAHAHGAKVLLNGDVALAQELGADGVQLTGAQLAQLSERPRVEWCAASCHTAEELRRAEALGCDFALLSPVLPTLSHPGAAHLGWGGFAALAQDCSIPIYALGGLTLKDEETARLHGAHGIALLRQAWPEVSSN
ncbi:Nudix family hydrolase [Ferriphaselus sp. R-1]|uniref:Nudix family hydrolase n=1 Tax=Ferriphaselus sp. R-1 TaxID=1485544 RepID=UPI000556D059|nr:Nudix family hydrolase [Ferriphaselus sp. R-1]